MSELQRVTNQPLLRNEIDTYIVLGQNALTPGFSTRAHPTSIPTYLLKVAHVGQLGFSLY